MKYKKTYELWDNLIKPLIPKMLEFENNNADDYKFVNIELDSIRTSAEKKSDGSLVPSFWVGVAINLDTVDAETNEFVEPTPTKYYVLTKSDGVYLMHQDLDESFSEIWDTDKHIEYSLVQAILLDMIDINELCLKGLTKETFSIIFEENYLNVEDFSDEAKAAYFERFDEPSMLSREAQDIFIF